MQQGAAKSAAEGEYPWWALILKEELYEAADQWLWLAWGVSGQDALRAQEIYHNMSYHDVAIMAAIETYQNSWQPKK